MSKSGLRIICYHNFSKGIEVKWKPKLFITPDTFIKRLKFFEKNNFSVLSIDEALNLLQTNKLPRRPVVITMDDGWVGIRKYAHPLLSEKNFPYTIYLTTYYSSKASPVFNLLIEYFFWISTKKYANFSDCKFPFYCDENISDQEIKNSICNKIIEYGNQLSNSDRIKISACVGKALNVDFQKILNSRVLEIMSLKEIEKISLEGVDIQLHTHRHCWPLNQKEAISEIVDNRNYLKQAINHDLKHFCYPSGFYNPSQFPFLKKTNILSAVTCNPGLNYQSTSKYVLNRFLDGENISQIEFEAEMCGFLEFLRKIRNILRPFKRQT